MEYIVIENHRTEFPDPIILTSGEKVLVGEESGENWANWIFCTKMDNSNSGWVPKQIIDCKANFGIITENYSAKELDIDAETIVEGVKELNGWLWSRNKKTDEIGWIPLEKLERVD